MERPENYENDGVYFVKIENGESEVYKLPDDENVTAFEENIALKNRIEKAEEVIDILKADLESESKSEEVYSNWLKKNRNVR